MLAISVTQTEMLLLKTRSGSRLCTDCEPKDQIQGDLRSASAEKLHAKQRHSLLLRGYLRLLAHSPDFMVGSFVVILIPAFPLFIFKVLLQQSVL